MPKIERCPCGSGKPRSHCCEELAKRRRLKWVVCGLLILVTGGAVAALSLPEASKPVATAQPTPVGAAPAPYEYDPETNRHWDPDHGHWHDGLPPDLGAPITSGIKPHSGTPLATGAETPAAWEYDAATDKHWHPTHGHWHDGKPPNMNEQIVGAGGIENISKLPPEILNPAPWQYDPVTNQHYHPEHKHWHNGPPPQ